jgi:hypothetical protein
MKGQLNLFAGLPPPQDRPMRFKPAQRPIWTENKAKLIERYLYYFVMVTKHVGACPVTLACCSFVIE